MRYFISDSHFGHRNIIEYEKRPFGDVLMMDACMVDRWNEAVSDDDTVYFLGDFAFGSLSYCRDIFSRLQGKKVALVGNHDKRKKLEDVGFVGVFEEAVIKLDRFLVKLVHIPPIFWNLGTSTIDFCMHGHVHSKKPLIDGRLVNVSAEVLDYRPISEVELVKLMKKSLKAASP